MLSRTSSTDSRSLRSGSSLVRRLSSATSFMASSRSIGRVLPGVSWLLRRAAGSGGADGLPVVAGDLHAAPARPGAGRHPVGELVLAPAAGAVRALHRVDARAPPRRHRPGGDRLVEAVQLADLLAAAALAVHEEADGVLAAGAATALLPDLGERREAARCGAPAPHGQAVAEAAAQHVAAVPQLDVAQLAPGHRSSSRGWLPGGAQDRGHRAPPDGLGGLRAGGGGTRLGGRAPL